ncbi:hypothetical protein CKA32_005594 [Geitlerinema sp. FC II]|nr:hypothetical protein CKA32_005594 [Geitlerinema sp. FC II]
MGFSTIQFPRIRGVFVKFQSLEGIFGFFNASATPRTKENSHFNP